MSNEDTAATNRLVLENDSNFIEGGFATNYPTCAPLLADWSCSTQWSSRKLDMTDMVRIKVAIIANFLQRTQATRTRYEYDAEHRNYKHATFVTLLT